MCDGRIVEEGRKVVVEGRRGGSGRWEEASVRGRCSYSAWALAIGV